MRQLGPGQASSGARADRVSTRGATARSSRPSARGHGPEDLADRLILALVNECVACLRERIVEDADLIDAGVIFGTGFAPFRGGPLTYARARGIDACTARLDGLARRYGARFSPDAGWSALRDGV